VRALFVDEGVTWSGGSRAFAAAARGLAAGGWSVRYACEERGVVYDHVARLGIDLVPLPLGAGWLRASSRLRDAVQRGTDVAFVHSDREQLDAATAVWRASQGAVVRRLGAGDTLTVGQSTRGALRLAPTALLCTTADQTALAADFGGVPHAVADIGVDVDRVAAASAAAPALASEDEEDDEELRTHIRRLVCVCDVASRARTFVVLRAVAMLAPRHPELQLLLVGSGAGDTQLRMHAAALGIHRVVRYRVGDEEVTPGIAAADVGWVVAAGDDGAFGVLDFMAVGVPVFAERGSVPARYVADNITGRHLDAGDVPGTAAALASLLARDEERRAMGSAGRARVVRAYGEGAMIDGFDRIATAAVARARRRSR
jgi:hypothetical protein